MDFFKPKSKCLILIPGFFSSLGYSPIAISGSVHAPNNFKMVLGVLGGVFWSSIPDAISINNGANVPAPYNTDRYSIERETAPSLALQVGFEWQRKKRWFPSYSLGLQIVHYRLQSIKGTITQYSLPQFKNYRYNWDVKTDALSLYSRLDLFQSGPIRPFVNAGIGLAINRSNNFYETAFAGVTPRISPEFGDNMQYNFAYHLGAGIDYFISPKLSLLFAYNYQSLGSQRSGNGLKTWSEDYLNIPNYKINKLLFGVNYRFDSKD